MIRWVPLPLWCYLVPMLMNTLGWLPVSHPAYQWITDWVFPVALACLLLGTNLVELSRVGAGALLAMGLGTAGITLAAPGMVWLLHAALPGEAWKGAGVLAATWTGGSLNMVALRTVLEVPADIFAPLIVVDALIAYGWMAVLVAAKGCEPQLDRWLCAVPADVPTSTTADEPPMASTSARLMGVGVFAVGLTLLCAWVARGLPRGGVVASSAGWTVLLVTTVSLAMASIPPVRRLSRPGAKLGYPCLYVVLAALGAQANLRALISTPAWILVGTGMLLGHVLVIVVGGRWLRLPWGLLATASQANVGGVVSAPLVGAVYQQRLAPVGLLLALAGNAVGTYLGLWAATMSRWLGADG